jgi:dTDP-4-dehydrorhamnose reductase
MNLFVRQQKNFTRIFMKKDDKKILLLGGKGFLGQGLANVLSNLKIRYEIIDKDNMDLSDINNIIKLS